MPESINTVVDDIYEASVLPELWPSVLERVGRITDSWGAALFTADSKRSVRFQATENYSPHIERVDYAVMQRNNPRPARALARKHAGFLADLDLCTPAELENDPIYKEILAPVGLGWTVGSIIPVPNGDIVVFDLVRAKERGPFERRDISALDKLRPHLARSALLSARLGLQNARAATALMQILGLPGAVLDAGGRVLAANPLLEALSFQIDIQAFDRLRLFNRPAQSSLARALAGIERDDGDTRSIPVPATEAAPALVAHVIPIRRQAHAVFAKASALFVATPVTSPIAPNVGLLCGLFDLTPAEDRVARALTEGHSVESAAAELSVSRETVRSHLKNVMAKTGTSRQAELVGLLAGTTSFPLPRG